MEREKFGVCKDGNGAYLYTISGHSLTAKLTDFGAALVSLFVKDKNGSALDVVMGYDTLAQYEADTAYLGVTAGRCANRIAKGVFKLGGKEYRLDCNDGPNHLHGGFCGFGKKLWKAEQTDESSVKFTLLSPDGDQGYPGNLIACVVYAIKGDSLEISYRGMADGKTVFNLTNHSYFNLAGQGGGDILGHELAINADSVTAIDETLCPTGELMPVAGTPFDFRKAKKIGKDIGSDHIQMKYGKGYDHNFALNHTGGADAEVFCEESGIIMRVYTDSPGMQFYSGNFLNGGITLKGGRKASYRGGLCLETQFFPDAVNHPSFKSPVIEAGECYGYFTRFEFGTK